MSTRADFQRWMAGVQSRPVAIPVTASQDYAAAVASGCGVPALSSYADKLLFVHEDERPTCVTQLRRDAPLNRRVLKTFMDLQ
jgi:hypothetical protein